MSQLDLKGFLAVLRSTRAALPAAEKHGLEKGAVLIEQEARSMIGHYQSEAGPFVAWAELADGTKADRVQRGFTANDPLLRTGELLHSIGHTVEAPNAVIGSTSEIAVHQEFGTSHAAHPIPPRSFLGAAAFRKGEAAAKAIGETVAHHIAGRRLP